jgi:hypothetical protein
MGYLNVIDSKELNVEYIKKETAILNLWTILRAMIIRYVPCMA